MSTVIVVRTRHRYYLSLTVSSHSSLIGGDVTSSLQSAKMHLREATKNIKTGNSQAALMEINMTQ